MNGTFEIGDCNCVRLKLIVWSQTEMVLFGGLNVFMSTIYDWMMTSYFSTNQENILYRRIMFEQTIYQCNVYNMYSVQPLHKGWFGVSYQRSDGVEYVLDYIVKGQQLGNIFNGIQQHIVDRIESNRLIQNFNGIFPIFILLFFVFLIKFHIKRFMIWIKIFFSFYTNCSYTTYHIDGKSCAKFVFRFHLFESQTQQLRIVWCVCGCVLFCSKFDEWVFDEMFVHLFCCPRIEMDFNFMSDEALLMSVICSNWLNNEWPLCKCVRVHAKARVYVDSNRHEPSVHNLFPYFFHSLYISFLFWFWIFFSLFFLFFSQWNG